MQTFTFLDIIMAIAILAFIVTRFMGNELPKETAKQKKKSHLKVVKPEKVVEAETEEDGFSAIQKIDPSFNKRDFLKGAKHGYKMFYDALNNADDTLLDDLTAPRIYDVYLEEREALAEQNKKRITHVSKIISAELLGARIHGQTAIVEIKYVAQHQEGIVDIDVKNPALTDKETTTVWTWARNVKSTDPNWELESIESMQ